MFLRFGFFFSLIIKRHSFWLTQEFRVSNLSTKALTELKRSKKSSKASESFQYIARNINVFASASSAWQHNYTQLSPYLNGKLNATEEIGGVSRRKLLTLTFPLQSGSGRHTPLQLQCH